MTKSSANRARILLPLRRGRTVPSFEDFRDAQRVLAVLGKRLERYELVLHPEKTRFVDFRATRPGDRHHPDTHGTTFDFLGFTHVWGKSRKGRSVVRQVTAKSRYARGLAAVTDWCRRNRHQTIPEQHAHLTAMARGHDAYYGIAGNSRRLQWFAEQLVRIWKKWLSRRDNKGVFRWSQMNALLKRHPLPGPRIIHCYDALSEAPSWGTGCLEFSTSGSVGGGGGNIPTYPAD